MKNLIKNLFRKILALYQRWQVSIPTTKFSTQWEDDFKRSDFGGLFEEYLEMGKRSLFRNNFHSEFSSSTIRFYYNICCSISYCAIICLTQ
jgi:hypothetical protein